jgi:hypothetical protein
MFENIKMKKILILIFIVVLFVGCGNTNHNLYKFNLKEKKVVLKDTKLNDKLTDNEKEAILYKILGANAFGIYSLSDHWKTRSGDFVYITYGIEYIYNNNEIIKKDISNCKVKKPSTYKDSSNLLTNLIVNSLVGHDSETKSIKCAYSTDIAKRVKEHDEKAMENIDEKYEIEVKNYLESKLKFKNFPKNFTIQTDYDLPASLISRLKDHILSEYNARKTMTKNYNMFFPKYDKNKHIKFTTDFSYLSFPIYSINKIEMRYWSNNMTFEDNNLFLIAYFDNVMELKGFTVTNKTKQFIKPSTISIYYNNIVYTQKLNENVVFPPDAVSNLIVNYPYINRLPVNDLKQKVKVGLALDYTIKNNPKTLYDVKKINGLEILSNEIF